MLYYSFTLLLPLVALTWFGHQCFRKRQFALLAGHMLYIVCICFNLYTRHSACIEGSYPLPYLNAVHRLFIVPVIPLAYYFICKMFNTSLPGSDIRGMALISSMCLPSILYDIINPNELISTSNGGMNLIRIALSRKVIFEMGLAGTVFVAQSIYVIVRLLQLHSKIKQQQLHTSRQVKVLLGLMLGVMILIMSNNTLVREFYTEAHVADMQLLACILLVTFWIIALTMIRFDRTLLDANNRPQRLERDPVDALTIGIRYLLEEQKIYVRQGLKVEDLARMLGTNRTYLSTAIHKCYCCSFPELITMKRVAEAKRLLREEPGLRISEVAERSGFSSLSVFGKMFRETTGMTAKEYRNSINKT